MTQLVVGVDIDGTLAPATSDPRIIAAPTEQGYALLGGLASRGACVCIWSCRATHLVKAWLAYYDLEQYVQHVNDSPLPADDRKLPFHVYVGDDALRWDGDAKRALTRIDAVRALEYGDPDLLYRDKAPVLHYGGTGELYLDMFRHAWKDLWRKDHPKPTCLLTICSHAKPYAKSYIHMEIRRRLYVEGLLDMVDYAHISSAGIIPSGKGFEHPYNAYDWNNTQAIRPVVDLLRTKMTDDLIWWRNNISERYARIVVYLRAPGNTSTAARSALEARENVRLCFVPAVSLPWALQHDADDGLAHTSNLTQLIHTMKGQ